jgi:hypothetical protein
MPLQQQLHVLKAAAFEKYGNLMQIANLYRCLLALCFIGEAFGFDLTWTWYSDNSCATPVSGSTFNGAANPLIVPSNYCFLVFDDGTTRHYQKATECSSTTELLLYADASCGTPRNPQPFTNPTPVGVCINTNFLPPSVGSYKISCRSFFFPKSSAASAVPVAFFAAFAALISLGI